MYSITIKVEDPTKALNLLVELGNWTGISIDDVVEWTQTATEVPPANGRKRPSDAKKHVKTRTRWTQAEEKTLRKLHRDGVSHAEMARILGRTPAAVYARIGVLQNRKASKKTEASAEAE